MSETANLALPYLEAAQAQKHVTHNEALTALDTLVQLACISKARTAPPANPAEGDRYLINAGAPTGAWAGWAGRIVRFQDGAWRSFIPKPGWLAFVLDEAELYAYAGNAWAAFSSSLTVLQNLSRLGIGTTADAGNPFSAKLNNALWTALTTGEGGTGDLRYTLNKQAPGNVLSLLFQSGWSGRAELGLTGGDDLTIKVSSDGGTFREAMRIDAANGNVDTLAAEVSVTAGATIDLGSLDAAQITVTGTGTVSSFGTVANRIRFLRFTGAATLTHNATSLVLPGGTNLVTAAGDTAQATSDAAGNWTVRAFQRATGKPVVGPASTDISNSSSIGRQVLTGTAAQGATALALGTASSPTFAALTLNGAITTTGAASFGGVVAHSADNANSFGSASRRATVVYAATGTINTSDARDKTDVEPLTDAQIAAATALAREIGTFRFLDAVALKGDGARLHVGMTVQRAVDILAAHGLDPFALGLVCHDAWDATEPAPAIEGREAEYDEDGTMTRAAIPAHPAVPGSPAGERFGFRVDQLLLFLARGFDARLSALERLAPQGSGGLGATAP